MRTAGFAFGFVAILGGALIAAPGLTLVGLLAVFATFVTELWSRYGLRSLRYDRRLERDRAVWGDELALEVSVWNDKALPLAWLRVDDFATDGVVVREKPLVPSTMPGFGVMTTSWAIGWFERVTRHLTIYADRRGVFSFGPVRLSVADLFGRGAATEEHEDPRTFIVRPRSVPVRHAGSHRAPLGSLRSRSGLFEDPSLFAGVRPYQPGDPLRRVHWRATARTGAPVSKRFDPSRAREVLIALDVQTSEGPHWALHYDDELVESLMVAAASLARDALAGGASVGLAAAAYSRRVERFVLVAPRAGQDQLAAVADVLGRLSEVASAPFEHLLTHVPRAVGPGTQVVVVTARDPSPYLAALRRLDRSGFPVELIGLGARGVSAVSRARAFGLTASEASLTPDWRTSDALVLAG